MRIDFHCHLFQPMDTRRMVEAGSIVFKGYGFYERMAKKFNEIESIETKNIMEKTLFHLNSAKIDKV
ncbi:MAG: hypothetical protein ACFFHD_08405, partial [Promethearchaeota archaeon]